jgi:hypothetical protein
MTRLTLLGDECLIGQGIIKRLKVTFDHGSQVVVELERASRPAETSPTARQSKRTGHEPFIYKVPLGANRSDHSGRNS